MHKNTFFTKTAGLAGVTLIALAAAPAQAQILQNGGFETASNQTDTYHNLPVYSSASGWTTTGEVLFTGAEGTSQGSEAATFNGANEPAGNLLSQTFSTQAGTVYTVTFDFGAFGSPGTEKLAATATDGSTVLGGTTAIDSLPTAPATFSPYLFQFTADSAATTLTFDDTGSDTSGVDGVLDNVQVVAPEPSPAAAFAFTGLGAVGLILRAKRRARR